MTSRNGFLVLVFAAMFAIGSLGCGDETAPPEPPAAKPARKAPLAPRVPESAPQAVEAAGAEEDEAEEAVTTYVVEGRRDPFRSFQFTSAREPIVNAGPLSDFDLSQLSIVGVIWNATNPRALVTDPGGRSFVLRQGSPIGKNNGRVVRIDDDMILVREKFVDFEGAVSTKDVEMRIRKIQGG